MFEGRNGLWLNWKPSFISLYLFHAISNIIIPLLCGKSSTILYVLFLLPSMKKCHKFVYDTSCKWLSFANAKMNITSHEHNHNSKCSCSWFFVQSLFYAYMLTKNKLKRKQNISEIPSVGISAWVVYHRVEIC